MKIIPYILVLLLLGCGGGGSASTSSDQSQSKGSIAKLGAILVEEPQEVIVSNEERKVIAFAKLRELCLSIEDTSYDEKNNQCICKQKPSQRTKFKLVNTRRDVRSITPRCQVVKPLVPPQGVTSFKALLEEQGVDAFRKAIDDFSIQGAVFQELKLMGSFTDGDAVKFAASLDEKPLYFDLPPYFGLGGEIAMYLGYDHEDIKDSSVQYYIKQLPSLHLAYSRPREVGTIWGQRHSMFVKNHTAFHDLLGLPPADRKGWNFPAVSGEDKNFSELQRLRLVTESLNRYLFGDGEPLNFTRDFVYIGTDGCHYRCSISREFIHEGDRYRYEKVYVYGEVVSSRILRFEGDKKIPHGMARSMVYLGRGDAVSLVMVNKKKTDRLTGGWILDIYDESIQYVGTIDEDLIHFPDALDEALNLQNEKVSNSSPVIMLEDLVDYRDMELMRWVKKGPYLSRNYLEGGSVFGWHNMPKGDTLGFKYSDFYDGLFIPDLDQPKKDEKFYHGNNVGRLIVGTSEDEGAVSLIPSSSFERGNDEMERFVQLVETSGARVINKSFILHVDAKYSCPLNNVRLLKNALSVLGAGNNSLENRTDLCDQSLEPIHRRLVVAANVEGSTELEGYSDYGRTYADLSASGVSYDMHGERSSGTSYAAPRVSHVAATIVNKFGANLPNQLVRLAILLSVNVNVDAPSLTRTGGSLNKDNALRAAAFMNSVVTGAIPFPDGLSKREVMARIIKASGSITDDSQIERQIDWLLSNGV